MEIFGISIWIFLAIFLGYKAIKYGFRSIVNILKFLVISYVVSLILNYLGIINFHFFIF